MKSPLAIVFANLKGNIGDFAILHSMLQDIHAAYPGHPVHVYSHGFHPIDEERTKAFATLAPPFEVAGGTFRETEYPGRGTVRLARFLGLWPAFQGYRIRALARKSAPLAAHFGQYHAVFLTGGAQWTGANSGVSMFATLRAIHAHNDRVFGYPFSVYSSVRNMNRKGALCADFARIGRPLIARDSQTKKILDGLSLPAVLGADCVYSLQDIAEAVAPSSGRDRSRILLAVTGQSRGELEAAVRTLGGSGAAVELLTTCEAEDGSVMKEVSASCGIGYRAPLSWQETVAEMKASALVVSNRLHGLIFGSFTGTPLLPLTNRAKTLAFAKDARVPFNVKSLSELDAGIAGRAIAAREEILARVGEYRDGARSAVRTPIAFSMSG